MGLDASQKADIERRIINIILKSLEDDGLSDEQMKEMSSFASQKLSVVETSTQMMEFLGELARKWKIFEGMELIEKGNIKGGVEDEVYSGALTLIEHGKIEEALKLAKSATKN